MSLIFRRQINQQVGGNLNVSVGRFTQEALPVLCFNRILAAPVSRPAWGVAHISIELWSPPRFNNFSKTIHGDYCGDIPQTCQGVNPQCFIWSNQRKLPL